MRVTDQDNCEDRSWASRFTNDILAWFVACRWLLPLSAAYCGSKISTRGCEACCYPESPLREFVTAHFVSLNVLQQKGSQWEVHTLLPKFWSKETHNFIKVSVMLVQVPGIVELLLYYMFPQIGQIINPIEHLWAVYIYLHFMIINCNPLLCSTHSSKCYLSFA